MILTGAGISAESGLGTFRDTDGLWTKYPLEEVATPEGFARNPLKVHEFYNARRANALASEPNAAHHALTRLQSDPRFETVIITQNIDDLHERAGSQALHMHGEILSALCASCAHRWPAPPVMHPADPCPRCKVSATRPDIVWFGEMPEHMERIEAALMGCRQFVAIGTSGTVYPAAGFVALARRAGAETLELNLAPSEVAGDFTDARYGPASEIVPAWVEEVLAQFE